MAEMDNGKYEDKGKEVTDKMASETEELPKAIVRRLVKEKLSEISVDSEAHVLRDALQAFSESTRIFIHYLSSAANDVCKESNRQIINVEDVFKALEEIDFPQFIGPLRASLEEFRQKKSGATMVKNNRASKAKDGSKKPKRKETSTKSEGKKKRRG